MKKPDGRKSRDTVPLRHTGTMQLTIAIIVLNTCTQQYTSSVAVLLGQAIFLATHAWKSTPGTRKLLN
jgi:hypothetical protein